MAHLVERTYGSVRWQVDPDFLGGDELGAAGGLFHAPGLAAEEWVKTGRATVVKHGPHQSVYHVVLPGIDFYLKHYRLANTRAWLRSLLRPAKARLEFERTRLAAQRGLPTLTPLAAGEAVADGGTRSSYLVTRTLPDAVPLNRYLEATLPMLEPRRRSRLRQQLALALGQLLARLHQAGVTYRDLHPGNLLLQLDDDEQPRLYLIDVYAVRFGPPLSARQSRDNLIILNRWFMLRSERSDRLRCWHAYQEMRNQLREEIAEAPALGWRTLLAPWHPLARCDADARVVRDLERGTLSSNLRFWRNLDQRCLGTNRHFNRVRRGEVSGHVVAGLERELLARLLTDPDEPFRLPDVMRLKHSASSTVIELGPTATCNGKRLILKRFAVTRWTDPWVSLLRRTPALRSFVQGHGLDLRCLPTPRPLAVLHRRQNGMLHEGYLLTEKIEDAVDLLAFVNRLGTAAGGDRHNSLRELIAQVARLVGILHQRRLSHRDLKAANLLVRTDPTSHELSVWFIDLVGVVRHRRVGDGRRVQNLARLHTSFREHNQITRADKLRFLRAYLCWGLRGKQGWKTWWRQIEEATREKVARNLRRGRPLG